MMETRIGPKKQLFALATKVSVAATLLPPKKIAVFFRSLGPRVNIAPWTIVWLDARSCKKLVNVRVDCYDSIKSTGLRVGIKLEQNFGFGHF
jgi:hypothetical protein